MLPERATIDGCLPRRSPRRRTPTIRARRPRRPRSARPPAAPEEPAIAAAARSAGLAEDRTASATTVARIIPFSSARKRVTVVACTGDDGYRAYVKGAPEAILSLLASPRPDLGRIAQTWA